MNSLIDRRLNGRNKSAVNRSRFIRRYKEQIRKAVRGMVDERSITDMDQGGDVNLPTRDISEPTFRHGQGGDREMVHPGNKEFARGDTIDRPRGGGGGKPGGQGEGDAVDQFTFTLSRAEFLELFFEDLALPNLVRNQLGDTKHTKLRRAGYTTTGAPSMLSVRRTLQTSLSRRIALGAGGNGELARAQTAYEDAQARGASDEELAELDAEIDACRARLGHVPFLDDLDLRYRHRVAEPAPVARAVMFCLMDVSGSMDENKKDLAKRFFTLLYLFLTRNYEQVDLVFIRHTEDAEEVDEDTFFHDPKSGGTVVLSALELMHEIVADRYPSSSWNIYAAQATDGDAFGADAGRSARYLSEKLLPLTRYFAYIEVVEPDETRRSSLWVEYERETAEHFAMRRVRERSEIYPVFRDLFKKETA
ncbi:YeaH/YhbH family protein [Achromobacter sp. GG226]|uniref:YeaH/YhbH family protein n=1 Tax=Verticiella alkaliphila TaxID=2779529 RepID=UPI001C0AB5EC|nr:YeaH/YhbH family protein [Verticiella sp. GG226]MBU4610096.1 YeaH/YhbH family protein [Verticiella sp. GG226]